MYKFHNVDGKVRHSFMNHYGKVESYCINLFVVSNVKEMAAESLSYHLLCLSNIMFAAYFASNAVNKAGTFANYVVFAGVYFFPVTVHLNLSSLLRRGQNCHFVLVQRVFSMLVLQHL